MFIKCTSSVKKDDITVNLFVNALAVAFRNDLHGFGLFTNLVCTVVVSSIFLQLLLKNVKVSRDKRGKFS